MKCTDKDCHCPAGVDRSRLRDEIMPRIIDGQASNDEEKYFFEVVEKCVHCECKEKCTEQLAIKFLLKNNLKRLKVPDDLRQSIRAAMNSDFY
ncbi:MAG: hypothetical protein JJU28_04120 [Cyclobacteriaceae bacterium]|nr:hypothetical protein [Cyclobacteriaceae bacterium]